MFSQVALICLLAQTVSTVYGDYVMVDVIRPKLKSIKAHEELIQEFWTPERLKSAKSLDVVLSQQTLKSIMNEVKNTTEPPSTVPGSLPERTSMLSKIISSNGGQIRTTGRIFWQVGSYSYSCSGSVVASTSNDLISTAGHCVYDTDTKQWYNNNNWIFIPAYSDGNAPYGKYPARRMLSNSAWTTTANFRYDFAFVAVSTVNGRHIQSVVGAQGIGFNYPRLAYTYSFGYPSNLDSGRYLKSCAGYTQKSQYTASGYDGQGLPCNMGQGCSGGPWLQNVDESKGLGYITSVNSFIISNVPNVMNGPYFDSNAQAIYNQAKSM